MAPRRRTKKVFKSKTAAKSVRKIVKKMINKEIESKHIDASVANTVSGPTGLLTDLTLIGQGTGDQTRIGDKLKPVSLEIRGQLLGNTAIDRNLLRMIVFQWHPNSASPVPVSSDILLYTASAANAVLSPYQWDTRQNFTILSDKTYQLQGSASSDDYHTYFHLKLSPKRVISFNAGGTTGLNKIYVLCVSDSSAINFPSIQYIYQLRYKDA